MDTKQFIATLLSRLCVWGLAVCSVSVAAIVAQAADVAAYPNRPIRLIAPFAPGGSGDIVSRLIATKLGERLGQQVIVDNRAGASGLVGLELAIRAAADGYTLVMVSTSHTQLPAIQAVPYDMAKSLAPIALIANGPSSICAHPGFAAQNIKELVATASAKPGSVRYASSGAGGINHFAGEYFNQLARVNLMHVPYKGGGPAIIDVISGQVETMFGSVLAVLPHVRSGRMKALGVTKRTPLLPQVAAISETVPGYEASIWWGIAAPAALPAVLATRLNREINDVLRDPEMAKRLTSEAAEPVTAAPAVLGKLIAEDLLKWRRIAKETGIRAD